MEIKKENIVLKLKTLALASIIGVIVGALDALFGRVLLFISAVRSEHVVWLVPFLGFAGLLSVLLYKKVSEESLKGMGLVMQTGHGENEAIPLPLIPLIMVGTWLTHLFGGSAGREGVAVQLGATVSHAIGQKLKMPDNSRVLLITGMAAGFAGLFQTPLAATFFAMEVMVTGLIQYDALLPSVTASFIASTTSHLLGLEKFSVDVNDTIIWTGENIIKIIAIALIFGIVGGAFAYLLKKFKGKFSKWFENPLKRIFVTGTCLAVVFLVFHFGRYCGLGTNLISASFSGEKIYNYDWAVKIILTVLTLSVGYQGGEVTPLFSIGASLGVCLAHFLGLPVMLVAGLGYAAVFGAATNTLLAPILIGVEVFGSNNIFAFVIVCILAYTFNGNQTIYGAQKNYIFHKRVIK